MVEVLGMGVGGEPYKTKIKDKNMPDVYTRVGGGLRFSRGVAWQSRSETAQQSGRLLLL